MRPTAVGEVIQRRGSVTIHPGFPFTSTVRGGDTVSVGTGSAATIQTEGGLQLELAALPGADGASIKTGYWWEMGGGPYFFVTLERGRLDVRVAGPARRRWWLEFKAPGVYILTHGTRILDHTVETDGKTTTVTTARKPESMDFLRVSATASTLSTNAEMSPGETLVVGAHGIRHGDTARLPALLHARPPVVPSPATRSVTTNTTSSK